MVTPRLEIYPDRIAENARAISDLVHGHGAQLAGVGKVLCAHPAVVKGLLAGGVDMYADSRIDNLRAVRESGVTVPLLLLRLPELSRIDDTVRYSDLCLVSEITTMSALAAEATKQGKRYGVICMVDLGDLREGVWDERIIETVVAAKALEGLDVLGIGCNLACYGGVSPSEQNMNRLVTLLEAAREASGLPLALVSGGNSSSLEMLAAGTMPTAVTHFRMGESIILGRNVLNRDPWPGTRQDAVRLVAEVIEVESKPSVPLGESGQNAFGETATYVDRGVRRRAIVALGRQDVVVDGIEPEDPGMIVLGGSSDHLIIDVEEAAKPVQVGDEIAFWPGYGATLALATSPYVTKVEL
ncbi:MAG: alanine/ornithine racemase family PLP-dependent enzyme [Propionibacteriaceae bacterium]